MRRTTVVRFWTVEAHAEPPVQEYSLDELYSVDGIRFQSFHDPYECCKAAQYIPVGRNSSSRYSGSQIIVGLTADGILLSI